MSSNIYTRVEFKSADSEQVSVVVKFWTFIREVLVSNLGSHISYPDWGFVVLPSA